MCKATAGKEKPQDCLVTVDLDAKRGIKIELNSKMEKMFGDQIREAAKEAAREMGVKAAKITIDDFGSLDFTIKARTKTAIARARGDLDE